jgi:uncharacterized protein (UPF0548 family)
VKTLASGRRKLKLGNGRARFYKAPQLTTLIRGAAMEGVAARTSSLNSPDCSTSDGKEVTITATNGEKGAR